MEDESISRRKKILSLLEQEIEDGEEMTAAVRNLAEKILLDEKGYSPDDLRKSVVFNVLLGAETVQSHVDFLVALEKRNVMVIKCAAGSLDSRERQVVAAARVLGEFPIPVAVVMDPMSAVVLDGVTGKVMGEGFESIPTKEQLYATVSGREIKPFPQEKVEREKRILLAFDTIRCCIPKGADGGVKIDAAQDDRACSCE
jgi:hypothetical protein